MDNPFVVIASAVCVRIAVTITDEFLRWVSERIRRRSR